VVNDNGTGAAARIPGLDIAGKTGTAQVVAKSKAEKGQDHAWFAAFAPAKAPEVVVVVIAERGGKGGQVAAPIARKILNAIFFEKVAAVYDDKGRRRLEATGEADVHVECDDVLVAIGQENAFPWIERDIGIKFDKWDMPVVDAVTHQSTHPKVFFGGDSAFGPKNIIWAVAHGHQAAISIDLLVSGRDVNDRPPPLVTLISQKMGIHEWSYDNDISLDKRRRVPLRDQKRPSPTSG
jgi:hypothetical protein